MLSAGDVVGDRYEIKALLARGGMADVHRGVDLTDGRPVAVKMMRIDAGDQRRFVREAQVLAALRHPNLVLLRDAGHHGARPYFVMDLVEGRTLAARLEEGPLAVEEGRTIGSEIAAALAYVHGRGVIHRDVKPSNILLDADGRALLSDFGVAWLSGGSRLTETSSTIGTAAFLAPEQVGGGGISAAVDVYALGLVLIEAMSGQHAFTGTHQEMLAARLARNPSIPAMLPGSWRRLLRAMTARDPSDRPAADVVSGYLAGATTTPGTAPVPREDPDATLVMRSGETPRPPSGERVAATAGLAPPAGPAPRAPYVWMGAALVAILAFGVFLVASFGGGGSPAASPASGDTTSTTASPTTTSTTTTTTTTTTLPPTTLAPTTQPVVVTDPPGDGDGRSRRQCRRLENQIQDIDDRLAEIEGDGGPLEQELQATRNQLQAEYDSDC